MSYESFTSVLCSLLQVYYVVFYTVEHTTVAPE